MGESRRRELERLVDSVIEGRSSEPKLPLSKTAPEEWIMANVIDIAHHSPLVQDDIEGERTVLAPLQRQDHWGQFKFVKWLGRGGFGDVWLARDPQLNRDVALKLVLPHYTGDPQFVGTALHEARLIAQIDHPNVVRVFGAAETDGQLGFWMEYIDGDNLHELIARIGPLAPKEVARIGSEVCTALAAVHQQGFLHLDVKAQNVMRAAGGRIVLMDFGSAALDSRRRDLGQGSLPGTPAYVAPELLVGDSPTPSSDIYSLGVLLYFLSTAQLPVEASSWKQLVEIHRRGTQRRILDVRASLPLAFVRIVEMALSPSPGRRPQTAAEMQGLLDDYAYSPSNLSGSPPKRPSWRWALAGLATLSAAVLAYFVIVGGPTPIGERTVLDVHVEFQRRSSDSDSFSTVTSGESVTEGDVLRLQVAFGDSLYLYVLNRDDQGRSYLLFPGEQWLAKNPVAPRHDLILPGKTTDGRNAEGWRIDSSANEESFLIVASSARLRELETALAGFSPPSVGNVGSGSPEPTRGTGAVSWSDKEVLPGAPGWEVVLAHISPELNDIWLRELTFPHASPAEDGDSR